MSYTLDIGYTRPVATKNLSLPDWDGQSDWNRINWTTLPNEPKGEVGAQYSCTSSSPMRPAILRRYWAPIKNVYDKNTKIIEINPANQSAVKNGAMIGENFYAVHKITDSTTNAEIYMPISGSINLNVGFHEAVTADVVKAFLCDMIDQFFPKATTTSNQIAAQLNRSFEFLDETT